VLLVAAGALLAACGDGSTEPPGSTEPSGSTEPTTTTERPASTDTPDESTSSVVPGDGRLAEEPSSTSVSGAEPGRPQLDAEPPG
jgi:hypothetical protein